MKRTSNFGLLWFFLGLGSNLQVLASLSLSELAVLLWAPCIIFGEFRQMRKTGISCFFWLSILVLLNCFVACIANGTAFVFVLRGAATLCIVSCAIIVGHYLLRRDMVGLRWWFLGSAISLVLCTFVMQRANEIAAAGLMQGDAHVTEAVMSGALFWSQRIGVWVTLPMNMFYLKTPFIYSQFAPLALALFTILTSSSGRSATLSLFAAAGLVFLGGKTISRMRNVSKHFWMLMIASVFAIFAFNALYRISATNGWIGEKQLKKYEAQSKHGTSVISLLIAGRLSSFVGLLACADKPFVGWGPWPYDNNGYYEEFLARYGTGEDYQDYMKLVEDRARYGYTRVGLIPAHSHITSFWLCYGVFGLIFWLYVIYVLLRYLWKDCWVVPQWYYWLACSIPGLFWHIFFSPFANRIGTPLFVVACLLARALHEGRLMMPYSMQKDIAKAANGR